MVDLWGTGLESSDSLSLDDAAESSTSLSVDEAVESSASLSLDDAVESSTSLSEDEAVESSASLSVDCAVDDAVDDEMALLARTGSGEFMALLGEDLVEAAGRLREAVVWIVPVAESQ